MPQTRHRVQNNKASFKKLLDREKNTSSKAAMDNQAALSGAFTQSGGSPHPLMINPNNVDS